MQLVCLPALWPDEWIAIHSSLFCVVSTLLEGGGGGGGEPMLTCGGFRPNVDTRVVPPQKVFDEGGFASAVLPQQQH